MIDVAQFKVFQVVYPEAKILSEGGFDFIHIPKFILPEGNTETEIEVLLCPQMRDGYMTRLFLSIPVMDKGTNWTQHHILGRTWHSWSWQNVEANQSLVQILLGHLAIFR